MQKIDIENVKKEFYKMKLVNFEDDENFEYYILDRDYVEKLEDFFNVMSKSTSHQLYVRNPLQENLQIYDRGGTFIAIYDKDDIIAVCIMDTCDKKDSLAHIKGLDEKDIKKSITLDTVCVLPKYRGNQLQKKIMLVAEYLYLKNNFKYMYMTISPNNYHSLKNSFDLQYTIFDIRQLYGTETKNPVTRCILELEIGKMLEEVPEQYSVINNDITAQKNVIELGFSGMKIINVFSEEKFFISYSKAFYTDNMNVILEQKEF